MARIGHRYGWWPTQKTKLSDLMMFLFDGEKDTTDTSSTSSHEGVKRSSNVCIGCREYLIHSKPVPKHYQLVDMAYCCTLCRINGCGYHGGKCERRSVKGSENEEEEDEDEVSPYVPIKVTDSLKHSKKSFHNAGYDAYCTGKIFIRLTEQWNGRLMPSAMSKKSLPTLEFKPYKTNSNSGNSDGNGNNGNDGDNSDGNDSDNSYLSDSDVRVKRVMTLCDHDDIYEVTFESLQSLQESLHVSPILVLQHADTDTTVDTDTDTSATAGTDTTRAAGTETDVAPLISSHTSYRIGDTILYVNGESCSSDIEYTELIEAETIEEDGTYTVGFLRKSARNVPYQYIPTTDSSSNSSSCDDSLPVNCIKSLKLPKNQINLMSCIYSLKLNTKYDPQVMAIYTPNRKSNQPIFQKSDERSRPRVDDGQRLRINLLSSNRMIQHTLKQNSTIDDVPFGGKKKMTHVEDDVESVGSDDGSSLHENKRRKM